MNSGKVPIYHSDGTAKLDQYARAKDIFALVLPFLTAVAGFWLGSQGTVQAQRQSRRRHRGGEEGAGAKVRDLVRSTANEGWY